MNYQIRKEDLQNDLLAETLQALFHCYNQLQLPLYVVGASARDIALRLLNVANTPRRTLDLDVAVALHDWKQYEELSQVLLQNHFTKAQEKQRFYYLGVDSKNKFEVDIVPFGTIAEKEQVTWPPEGSPVMSVRCFEDVMRYADDVQVEEDYTFKIAPLSGQFLIKLDTWQDRHLRTKKDATDMVFILQNIYVAYALSHDALPAEIDIDAEHFDVVVAGAEWIASDLRQMLTTEHRLFYANQLQEEVNKGEESALLNDFLDMSSAKYYNLFRRALQRMSEILKVL